MTDNGNGGYVMTINAAQIIGYAVNVQGDARGVQAIALADGDDVKLRIIAPTVAAGRIAYESAARATGCRVASYEVRLRRTYPVAERHVKSGQAGYFTDAGKYVAVLADDQATAS